MLTLPTSGVLTMTNSYSITGIFSRLIELIKKRLNSTTAWETMSTATFNMTDLSSACQMPMQNPRLDNSDLRELLAQATKKAATPDTESAIRHICNTSDDTEVKELVASTAARLRKQAEDANEDLRRHMETYAKNVDSVREQVTGVKLKKRGPDGLTDYEKELKIMIEDEINRLNDEHEKAVIRKQIELYGKSVAFNYSDQSGEWTLWPKTAEEYWRIAKEDFAIQRGEQESISPDALATMAEITNMIISLRDKHSGIPKSFMFTEKKPYHHNERHYIVPSHQIVNREGEGLTPVGRSALIRAKRDFDASIDSGEIYQVFMRLFCYLTMKERHLLYPVLCKQGPVVGIDDSTLSNISEVTSNDDFCLKYKEIYDIFYNVK